MATRTRQRLLVAAIALATVAGASLVGLRAVEAQQRAEPRRHTVTIDATTYSPKTLTVAPGDIVTWVNKDLFPHTVTAKNGRFDSGDIAAGKSWTHTVGSEGLFAYYCIYHATMKGTLRIR